MVFGNIKDIKAYGMLEEQVLMCLKWAKEHDLTGLSAGGMRLMENVCLLISWSIVPQPPKNVSGRRTEIIWMCI